MTFPISWYVAAGFAIALGLQTYHVSTLKNDILELENREVKTQLIGEQTTRKIENVWGFKSEAINLAAAERTRALVLSLDIAADAYRRMQQRTASLVQQAKASCSRPVSTSDDGSDPIGVLAKLHGVSDKMAGMYAKIADERASRSLQCEQSYDAVRSEGATP